MDDPADLLDYIREHPEDLAARLVYADWLEEQGELGLAEMARLGVELCGLKEGDPRRAAAEERYEELGEREFARIPPLAGAPAAFLSWDCVGDRYYSGIMHALCLPGDRAIRRFLPAAEETLRRHPGLALAVQPDYEESVSAFSEHRYEPCSDEALEELLLAPPLARLRHLYFEPIYEVRAFDSEAGLLRALTAAPLVRLRALHIWGGLRARAAFALAEARHLGGLIELALPDGEVGEQGALALLGGGLGSLKRLTLRGVYRRSSSDHFSYRPNVGSEGAIALADHPGAARLTHLDLGGNDLTDDAAFALAASPHLAGLARLNVEGNLFSPGARAALRAAFGKRAIGLPPE
jgi:uncharacterized protein (TIGR02996 family)